MANLDAFIARWQDSGAAERANKDTFLLELCDVLEVARPSPTTGDSDRDQYVFERDAKMPHPGGEITFLWLHCANGFVFSPDRTRLPLPSPDRFSLATRNGFDFSCRQVHNAAQFRPLASRPKRVRFFTGPRPPTASLTGPIQPRDTEWLRFFLPPSAQRCTIRPLFSEATAKY